MYSKENSEIIHVLFIIKVVHPYLLSLSVSVSLSVVLIICCSYTGAGVLWQKTVR